MHDVTENTKRGGGFETLRNSKSPNLDKNELRQRYLTGWSFGGVDFWDGVSGDGAWDSESQGLAGHMGFATQWSPVSISPAV